MVTENDSFVEYSEGMNLHGNGEGTATAFNALRLGNDSFGECLGLIYLKIMRFVMERVAADLW